jgi:energy-coupling factor transporter ATP-binding protein EcfA2
VLRLEGVSYRYPGAQRDALHAVTLELPEGTVTGVVGATEAGKSTLCLVAGGLAPRVVGGRLVGDVTIDDSDVRSWPMHRLAEQVVTSLQDPAGQLSLMAETVFDEVAFGPANLGLPRKEVMARSEAALRAVGAEDLRGRDPERLSGGQQQLVVLAGLLAMRPRYLILDEPVAHLDASGSRAVLDTIKSVADAGTAVLVAEQRTEALAAMCDSLVVVAGGNIVARGRPREVLAEPTTIAFGIEALPQERLRRRLAELGLETDALDRGLAVPGRDPDAGDVRS